MIDTGPDEILIVPVDELADPVGAPFDGLREGPLPIGRPGKRRRRGGAIEHPALDLYAGYSFMLVRTALMRAEGWSPTAKRPQINDAWSAAGLLEHLKWADQEHLVTLSLDNHNRVNAIHEVAIGHATGAEQTAGNILKVAFLTAAQGLIIAHNHPSGQVEPSSDDLAMTSKLIDVGACVGVALLDALVVGQEGWLSLRELADTGGYGWRATGLAAMAENSGVIRREARRKIQTWQS
jgi:DNA repair protein RadC